MWPIREIEITFFRDLPMPDAAIWFMFITAWYPYATLEIMFLVSYSMYLLAKRKSLSVWIVLVVCLGTFGLSLVTSYYAAYIYPHLDSYDIAKALTEVLFCLIKFFLIWGTVSLARKLMNKRNVRFSRKVIIYLVLFTFILYLYYEYGALCYYHESMVLLDETKVYNGVLRFWQSVLPEYDPLHNVY